MKNDKSQLDLRIIKSILELEFLSLDEGNKEIRFLITINGKENQFIFSSLKDLISTKLGLESCEIICKDMLKIKDLNEHKLFDSHGIFIQHFMQQILKNFAHSQKSSPDITIIKYNKEKYQLIYSPKKQVNAFYAIRSLII